MANAVASKNLSSLILIARFASKAEALCKQLAAYYPGVRIGILQLDLSSLKDVRRTAGRLNNLTKSVDEMIDYASLIAILGKTLSEDRIEMQVATN